MKSQRSRTSSSLLSHVFVFLGQGAGVLAASASGANSLSAEQNTGQSQAANSPTVRGFHTIMKWRKGEVKQNQNLRFWDCGTKLGVLVEPNSMCLQTQNRPGSIEPVTRDLLFCSAFPLPSLGKNHPSCRSVIVLSNCLPTNITIQISLDFQFLLATNPLKPCEPFPIFKS